MREFKKENWAPKNWRFWTVEFKKTLESALDSKKIKPVHPKGNQSWIFIGRTDAEAPILWPPDVKNWFIRKDPDAGKDWKQEEKGTTEDEMVGWHHRLDGYEFEQDPGIGDGHGSLACCSPWGCKSQTWLTDWTELNWIESRKEQWKKPLEARLKEPEKLIKIRRSDYLRLCTHPSLISNPTLEVFSSVQLLNRVQLFVIPWTPGSSIHWVFCARVLDWVAISFSRGSSWPRDGNQVSCIVDMKCKTPNQILPSWDT